VFVFTLLLAHSFLIFLLLVAFKMYDADGNNKLDRTEIESLVADIFQVSMGFVPVPFTLRSDADM